MVTRTFLESEVSISQQREETVARIRMSNIPSIGITFKITEPSRKDDCLDRIIGVVRSLDIFRARFFFGEERLKQAVFKEEELISFEELSFGSEEEWTHWGNNLMDFSYLDYPLFKLYWVVVEGSRYPFIVLVCCRLLVDHTGAKALSKEILRYGRENENDRSALFGPSEPVLANNWEKERTAKLAGFWKASLAPPLPACQLVFDRLDVQSRRQNKKVWTELPAGSGPELDDFIKQHGGPPDCLFLAVFFIALYRFSADRDLCIHFHYPMAGYSLLPGNFENVLPFRRVVFGTESFLQFYYGLIAFYRNAIKNELPSLHIMEALGVDDTDLPLYWAYGFSYRQDDPPSNEPDGAMTVTDIAGMTGEHDIMLTTIRKGQRIYLGLEYNPCRYGEATAMRLLECMRTSTSAVLKFANDPIHTLKVLSGQEENRLLSDHACFYPSATPAPVHEVIERISMECPSAPAIAFNNEGMTYGELDKRAGGLADFLTNTFSVRGRPVGVCLPHDADSLVCLLAVLKAGGIFIPLPLPVAGDLPVGGALPVPGDQLKKRVETVRPEIIITRLGSKDAVAGILPVDYPASRLVTIDAGSYGCFDGHRVKVELDDTAVMRFSGNGHEIAAVGITHGSLIEHLGARADALGLSTGCKVLQDLPLTADRGIRQVLGTLIRGGTVVIPDADETAANHKHDGIAAGQVEWVEFDPSAARSFIDRAKQMQHDRRQFPSLKRILCYGEGWTWHLINDLINTGVKVMKTVGLWEPEVDDMVYAIGSEADTFSRIPVGKPFPNYTVTIRDEHSHLLPAGAIGEINLAGPGIERRFRQESCRTGILGRRTNSGDLERIGHKKERIYIRGKQLYLGEVEFYFNNHPLIEQAVVVLNKGQAEKEAKDKAAIIVFYKSREGAAGKEDICSFLLESTFIDFSKEKMIRVENIPLDAQGMIRHDQLMELVVEARVQAMYPQDDIQRRIMEIWKDVIGVGHDIDIRENFFSAGGNSLKALRIISGLFDAFNVQLDMKTVYDVWTIEKLASFVKADTASAAQGSAKVEAGERNSEGLYNASHSQARLWAVSQVRAASAAYNIEQIIELNDTADVSVLKQALAQLVEAYEILRTVFVYKEDRLMQKVLDGLDLNTIFFEASFGEGGPDSAAAYFLSLPPLIFDLSHGPLFNIRYLRLADSRKYILFTIHHIVSDFWSSTIVFDLLRDVYNALQRDETYRMGPPAIQYRDFARWHHDLLSNRRSQYVDYWKGKLNGVPMASGLPYDRTRPAQRSYKGRSLNLSLDAGIVARLNSISRENGANLLMTMFAVFNVALYKYTAQSKNIVMVHLAGRDNEYFKKQIGLFVNTLPLVAEIDPLTSFNETLSGVKKAFLEAYDSQHYPFDLLIDDLQIKWHSGQLPLSGIGFNWIYTGSAAVDGGAELGRVIPQGESGTSKFDILLTGIEQDRTTELSVEYNTDIYDAESIALFLEDISSICNRLPDGKAHVATLLEEDRDMAATFHFS